MSDLKLVWGEWGGDAVLAGDDLEREDDLRTAVILSLFLDARARDDDVAPASGDRRGWWGDYAAPLAAPVVDRDRTGSRLWLLSREKTLPEVLRRAHDYAAESLRWLTEDGVAQRVEVTASMPRPGWLGLHVCILLPGGETKTFDFATEN